MRTYYVTVWDGDLVESHYVDLAESEKANTTTFTEKLNLKEWPISVIIAWSIIEK